MVAFSSDIPPRKEILDTIAGVEKILDEQKLFLARQIVMRSITLTPSELAHLEVTLQSNILTTILSKVNPST